MLDSLSPDDAAALSGRALTRRVRQGQEIFRKGETAAGLYWLVSGSAQVTITSASGKELVVRRLGPRDVFGEIAVFDGEPRTASVRATEPSELAYVDARDLRELLTRRPGMALQVLRLFARRLRDTTEHLEDSFFLTMRARLAKTLLALAEDIGQKTARGVLIPEPLSQSLLARIVYATREEVNRELRRWETEGWIGKKDGLIELHALDALEDVALSMREG